MTSIYDYAYSVAFIKTQEKLLLSDNEVERMILAKDANEAFKILNESDYADNKAGIGSVSEFQTVLDEGLMDIKELLVKITPDQEVLHILWHTYDFHNIKTMLKAKLSGKAFEDIAGMLNPAGAISIEALRSFIFEERPTPFGLKKLTENYIKKKIEKAKALFEKEKNNPQVIDLYLDQKLMKVISGIAKDSRSEFLIEFVKKLIDLNNIKLFFRMKAQGKELDLFEIACLWNGNIPYEKFRAAYQSKLSEFPTIMRSTDYAKIIANGYKYYEEEKTFIHLEKEIENYLTEYIGETKFIVFGPEPLIAYFLAKRNNALIMRMILISKLNNIEPEEIRSRLRQIHS